MAYDETPAQRIRGELQDRPADAPDDGLAEWVARDAGFAAALPANQPQR